MYVFVCVQDNVPHVPESSKKYEFYEKLRSRFKDQTEHFIQNIDKFKEECNTTFEPTYGKIDYEIMVFADEVSMVKAYWRCIRENCNDYLLFFCSSLWNSLPEYLIFRHEV